MASSSSCAAVKGRGSRGVSGEEEAEAFHWDHIWECHKCTDPAGSNIHISMHFCPACNHQRCEDCPTEAVKIYDRESAHGKQSHSVLGLSPSPSANSKDLPRRSSLYSSSEAVVDELNDGVLYLIKDGKGEGVTVRKRGIHDGTLSVKDLRLTAARLLRISDATQTRLFYRGEEMIDDGKSCRDYGLTDNAEVLCSSGEVEKTSDSFDDDLEMSERKGGLKITRGDKGTMHSEGVASQMKLDDSLERRSELLQQKAAIHKKLSNFYDDILRLPMEARERRAVIQREIDLANGMIGGLQMTIEMLDNQILVLQQRKGLTDLSQTVASKVGLGQMIQNTPPHKLAIPERPKFVDLEHSEDVSDSENSENLSPRPMGSGSEELFVYDSDPHDTLDRPQRFRSRTPSGVPMTRKPKGMSYNPHTLRWEGIEDELKQFDDPALETPTPGASIPDPMPHEDHLALGVNDIPQEPIAKKDFVSFFQKPYNRDAALVKQRRGGGSGLAWGYPIPEVPQKDFHLPEEFWRDRGTSELLQAFEEETSVSTIPEDISSVASVENDIFSTTGSTSSNSTVSSVRSTVIELIIGKFISDTELFSLYEAAVNRMGNAKFVRNQRRLLKKFFLDLRSQTKNHLQEEAIRILRGRAERTSMAEQIWRLINPANPSRSADMAALQNQKPDKNFQLERMLGPQKESSTTMPEQSLASNPSEDSESGSEGSNPVHDEAKYPNVDLATDFLLGGRPFKQYKNNIRGFLRLDPEIWTPNTLRQHVIKGDVTPVSKLLEDHFEEVAQLEFDWLHELLDIGCSPREMARLLIDGENAAPWILLDQPMSVEAMPQQQLHQPNCVHSGGQRIDTSPRVISTNLQIIGTQEQNGFSSPKSIVSELCGIAGAVPLVSSKLEWLSCVTFEGDANHVARINYGFCEGDSVAFSDSILEQPLLRILSALDNANTAVGFLQQKGLCCASFTILRLVRSQHMVKCIELCPVDIALIESLRSSLQLWSRNLSDHNELRIATVVASKVVSIVDETIGSSLNPHPHVPLDPIVCLNTCALAAQVLTLGILSYSQAHTGCLQPDFLVDPLSEVDFSGNDQFLNALITVKLLDFTCLRDMIEESVLVFCGEIPNDAQTSFDLLASPEDLADTWSPARFVTNTAISDGHAKLYAIEVGGGTINCADEVSRKFHWSPGSRRYDTSRPAFTSKEKILIGAITVNGHCPLNETQSWKDPATNAFIQHLGTRKATWELQEKHIGGQAGQYAVLGFNATYIKQNGVTLKQQQLMLPFNEIDLAFLNSTCGLQISFCTGVARRVALRKLLANVMIPFMESRASKPLLWKDLKAKGIVENFQEGNLDEWFDTLSPELSETAIMIVRSMLEVLKDTGIDRNGEELVVAWVRKESPYSCLRLRCEKTSLWARILADSEDCATFACITPLCFEVEKHKCRGLETAPWHNVTKMLDTAVCPQLSNRELTAVASSIAPWKLKHDVSYWIGKSGSNLIAKVWLTNEDAEPRLVIRQKVIPEKYRSRMPRGLVDRLGRLRERQACDAVAKQVVILAEI